MPLALIGSNFIGLLGIWIVMVLSFLLIIFATKPAVKKALNTTL